MSIQSIVQNYRSLIFNGKEFGIIKFLTNTPLDLRFGIPDDNIFRYWDVVDPYRFRYLKVDSDFNYYRDSIYDYPIIASHRLNKKNWKRYNKSMMIQVGACTDFVCWHCYLGREHIKGDKKIYEYVTGKEVVERYLVEREKYYQVKGESNDGVDLFRIHGGEPFLAPDLIYDILHEIKSLGLDNDIYVWSETNLSPLYYVGNEHSFIDDLGFDLKSLSQFKNFGLHPCFHGISKTDFQRNTALKEFEFEGFLNAYKKLIDSKIDIYPTFGSNVNDVKNLITFFNQIKQIDRGSLKRFALIEYKTYYETVVDRFMCWEDLNKKIDDKLRYILMLFQISNDKNCLLRDWNNLLMDEFGESYLNTDRVKVEI